MSEEKLYTQADLEAAVAAIVEAVWTRAQGMAQSVAQDAANKAYALGLARQVMRKRVVRDADGRIESVIDEPVALKR